MKEAMEAFWEHGYHATSVNDLLAEMKLNRGSLYGTFGDKRSLFLAALGEYERQGREAMAAALDRPVAARAALRQWVVEYAKTCCGQDGQRGCLGLKAAMELAPHDAEVARWVRQVSRRRERMVADAIERGQAEGDINARIDPRAAARYLLTALAGLRITGMWAPAEEELRDVVNLILRALD